MYIFRVSVSVFWGYPKSIISRGRNRTQGQQGTGSEKKVRTVEKLVNKDEVVLNSLLIELPKVAPPQLDEAVEELEDQGGIGIALGDGDEVDVLMLDMAEGGAAEGQDGRTNLRVRDDLDAENIGEARSAVVPEGTEDEVLALLIEDQNAGQHVAGVERV
jgi:hypothetical protein